MIMKDEKRGNTKRQDVYDKAVSQETNILLYATSVVEPCYQISCFTILEETKRQKNQFIQKAT